MRDHWRADDNFRARSKDRAAARRPVSPSNRRARDLSSEGLRIRGRASDEVPSTAVKRTSSGTTKNHTAAKVYDRSRSPRSRGVRGDERVRRDGEAKNDQDLRDRRNKREGDLLDSRRHREHRGPPAKEIFDYRDTARRRSQSPVARAHRGRASSKHRERVHSPARSSREESYSFAGRFGDSYIPSVRRQSRSPPRRHKARVSARGRSRSLERPVRPRPKSPTSPRPAVPSSRHHREHWDTKQASDHRRSSRSVEPPRRRRRSPSPPRLEQRPRHRQRSVSPAHKRRHHRTDSRDTSMQHSQAGSPTRPYANFDAPNNHASGNMSNPYSMRGQHRPVRPPRVETHFPYSSSPQWTPNSSYHGSPHSSSPLGHARGGWGGPQQSYHQQPGMNAYSPPHRHNSYPPQASPPGQFYSSGPQSPYPSHPHPQPAYHNNQSFRGNHHSGRGTPFGQAAERNFSGSSTSPAHGQAPSRGKNGGFRNLHWTASNSSRNGHDDLMKQTSANQNADPHEEEVDNPFRPSKDLQVEDQTEKENKAKVAASKTSPKEGSKISFAFKAKAPAPFAKPPPDLSLRVQDGTRGKDPPIDSKTLRKEHRKPDSRPGRDDPEKYRSRDYRYETNPRHDREYKRDQGRERSPKPKTEMRLVKHKRPQRTLSPSLADSTSVYFRKPGNESVVGSGTYGKVFKAIHVYTKDLAALKKIRMDGEKDGFPVTAVREIKLLQSLKHENIVSLQEVMVESNDCYMVFEYLSHDLTGLLNHPTFKLDHSHKKHLSKQLFEGLNHLHRRGVLHRDIKAANILISNEGQLKLADFGLARFYSKRGKPDYTNRVITIWYRSPELLLGETQYGPAVDIWSAACVMVEIFTRHAIFPGDGGEINQLDKIYNILGTPTREEWPGLVDMAWFELLRPTEKRMNTFAAKYQDRVTPAAFDLLLNMFLYDPNKRPSASDVLEHPYFTTEDPAPKQALE